MGNTVSPSDVNRKPLTRGQAGKLADLIVAAVLKLGLPSDLTQQILERQGATLANECALLLKQRVEALSNNLIIRRVRVNRSCTPQEMLDATGRKQYTNTKVVNAIPAGEGDEVEVILFNLGSCGSDEEVEEELRLRGLKPADVYALAAVNEADPSFADEYPNCTLWKDAQGEWCFAAFDRLRNVRGVCVRYLDGHWLGDWWFAGLRK